MPNLIFYLKKIIQKFCTILQHIYYLAFALSMILGLFYIRLTPRVSRDLWNAMTQYQLFITVVKIIFILVNIVIILRILKLIPEKTPSQLSQNIILFLRALVDYIVGLLINFYEFLGYMLTIVVKFLFNKDHFSYHCLRHLSIFVLGQKKIVVYLILIFIKLIPQSIFMLAFSYDVIVLQKLQYTFTCLPLLLIPLLEQFMVFIFINFYETNFESINSFLQTTVLEETANGPITKHEFIPKFQKSPPLWFKNFNDFFYNHYEVLNDIKNFVEAYKLWKLQHFPYYKIQLIFCILRLFLLLLTLLYNIL